LNTAQRVSIHSAGPDPLGGQVVRQPVGTGVHLRVRAALVAGHEVLAIAELVDGVLEQIGQVEFQTFPSGAPVARR
jgi:hypothetical protein